MRLNLLIVILVGTVIPAANAGTAASKNYPVSEVVRVLSPNLFECRLQDYKPAPSVRFRVILPKENPPKLTRQQLADRLEAAETIELRNITFRAYFRLEADVWIDGQPFYVRPDMKPVQHATGTGAPKTQKASDTRANIIQQSIPRLLQHPVVGAVPVRRIVSIGELINRRVDCSMLNDETPLEEALILLSESVEPPLPLVVLWYDLQTNAMIEKDTPIGVAGMRQMRLGQALKVILRSVTAPTRGPDLVLVAEGNIVKLGTRQTLYKDLNTHVYDVTDLLAVPSLGNLFGPSRQNSTGRNNSSSRNNSSNRNHGSGRPSGGGGR